MGPDSPSHPRAEPHLWPVITMGVILAAQVGLLQVALTRLVWGMYHEVFSPAAAVLSLTVIAWLLYRQLDPDTV